ncbi:hypothetical protein GCM10007940_45560 [Portibacter lacus]|uniref:Gliding motility-associated C-terminal domain-containing protein n=2 Tax=Portibacter lacus TaxID=1099794 RepID=A0AA37SYQ4_9BACT|nr:hypothetical protein GCM10007940_45560 [Portibacter lacus]
MVEICDNGLDDDNDGLIDINDPDCICETVTLESLIPNPSFEDHNCCPSKDSQLNCVDSWQQASGGTTDYLNTCDYLGGTEDILPFPDGEGALLFLTGSIIVGNSTQIYKEYAGVCLNSTMQKDSVYKLKFHLGFLNEETSPEIRFSFFGSESCTNLPFSIYADCPSSYPDWYFVKADRLENNGNYPGWVEVETTIQPKFDINALILGADCSQDSETKIRGYLIDNLRLSEESNFDFEQITQESQCSPDFTFAVAGNFSFTYQWYKEGIALIGETDPKLSKMYGEGRYQIRIINKASQQCRISDEFEFIITKNTTDVYETICEGNSLIYEGGVIDEAGIYEYNLISSEGCDSIIMVNVELLPNEIDTIQAKIFPGTTYEIGEYQFNEPGEYQLTFLSASGCDNTTVLQLENINVFIPNIFSPNGDNNNDYFEVYMVNDEYIMTEMTIFDRFGNLCYQGNQWDGTINNKLANSGVYIYNIKLVDSENHEWSFSNTITLIR